jgi:hypothetical protein
MKKRWTQELADFLRFCELERRLAPNDLLGLRAGRFGVSGLPAG